MPTDIVIDEDLMAQTMLATGLQTESETVELALRTLLQLQRQKEIRKFRGKLQWVGDLDAMRTDG
jgi:Arc/MetJ family transcription regulator